MDTYCPFIIATSNVKISSFHFTITPTPFKVLTVNVIIATFYDYTTSRHFTVAVHHFKAATSHCMIKKSRFSAADSKSWSAFLAFILAMSNMGELNHNLLVNPLLFQAYARFLRVHGTSIHSCYLHANVVLKRQLERQALTIRLSVWRKPPATSNHSRPLALVNLLFSILWLTMKHREGYINQARCLGRCVVAGRYDEHSSFTAYAQQGNTLQTLSSKC